MAPGHFHAVGDHVTGWHLPRSKNSGQIGAVPVLLYESSTSAGWVKAADLSLATAAGRTCCAYVAWDNRPQAGVPGAIRGQRGRLGTTGASRGSTDSGSAGPFNIHVGAKQNSVVLAWQSGQPGGACSQIYQSSRDAGATWSDPQPMSDDLLGCAEPNGFVTGLASSPQGPLYFLTETQSEIYLSL
jgi:hypothetical protein